MNMISKPLILKKEYRTPGTHFVKEFTFNCGNTVPIFEIDNYHGLNQLLGHAKFNNRKYGNIYYRGECHLHETLMPSLFRKINNISKAATKLNVLVELIKTDQLLSNEFKLKNTDNSLKEDKARIEGALQHYGIPTGFVDIVDNHWIALWMGLYKNIRIKKIKEYQHYVKREIPLVDIANGSPCVEDELFQYIILIAVPTFEMDNQDGVGISDDIIEVDLRKAISSVFLRPHAQHGLVVKKINHEATLEGFDLATEVIGILKIRIDKVALWLGNGELLSQDNLFPAPAFDTGYDILLSRNDIFDQTDFQIVKYI